MENTYSFDTKENILCCLLENEMSDVKISFKRRG